MSTRTVQVELNFKIRLESNSLPFCEELTQAWEVRRIVLEPTANVTFAK
jgi:hypothetical protein